MERLHRPVLLTEAIEFMNISEGGVYLDATFGEGNHTEAILKKLGTEGRLYAVDRDPTAIERYQLEGRFRADPRLSLIHGNFSRLESLIPNTFFDGILADLGVSTRQLVEPARGFSFQWEGPLDMRMDLESDRTLDSVLKQIRSRDLAEYLESYAELRHAKRVADEILYLHARGQLRTTMDLAKLGGSRRGKQHPATQLFMGLRMLVNEELEEINEAVPQFVHVLKPKGRLVVISFHSVEDRLVKRLLKEQCGGCVCSTIPCACPLVPNVKKVTAKPATPGRDELRSNPRSRSAKLRCVEKV